MMVLWAHLIDHDVVENGHSKKLGVAQITEI